MIITNYTTLVLKELKKLNYDKKGFIDFQVPEKFEPTLYLKHGEKIYYYISLVLILLIIFIRLKVKQFNPIKTKNKIRNFFLLICGWDKDADFHVSQGWAVEPLPWHGMNYQIYGREPRPKLNDAWIKKYNTRWIGPRTYKKINRITRTTNK